ncbi:hypothetical protein AUR64_13105 [Haloprofundus marisrubri]|uniref:Uncharacterized protein n=1 Tax=Haloprofundus marisrubri TaxID=1514971 RepID=A0A0W1R5S3_9EURY|nr:hypothetical protein [Haloprofundus marisrubri]KTG08760.1 hypothetical protein AUR64_13105 [Haloprofundus marisrubri]
MKDEFSRRRLLAAGGLSILGGVGYAAHRRQFVLDDVAAAAPPVGNVVTASDAHWNAAVTDFREAVSEFRRTREQTNILPSLDDSLVATGEFDGTVEHARTRLNRWEGVEELRAMTIRASLKAAYLDAATGRLSPAEARSRYDSFDSPSADVVRYDHGPFEACLVQAATAEFRLADARRRYGLAESSVDEVGSEETAYAMSHLAATRLFTNDADRLVVALPKRPNHRERLVTAYEALAPTTERNLERLRIEGMELSFLLGTMWAGTARENAERDYNGGQVASAVLHLLRARLVTPAIDELNAAASEINVPFSPRIETESHRATAEFETALSNADSPVSRLLLEPARGVLANAIQHAEQSSEYLYRERVRRHIYFEFRFARALATNVSPVMQTFRDATDGPS